MKYLGIDHGLAHIGLAVGDTESRVAVPVDTIHESDLEQQAAVVADMASEEGVDALVIGFPLTLEGEEHEQADITDKFIAVLAKRCDLEVHKEDERFSSEFAQRQKAEDPDGKFDEHALAATAILQGYLDRA